MTRADGATQPAVTPAGGRFLGVVRYALGLLAGAALFAMMVLTFVDVVGRKLLAHSLVGSVELTEMLMLAMIFAAMPLVSLAGSHVMFDLLDSFLPERLKRWQSTISNLICTVLLASAAWFVFGRAMRTQSMGDISPQLAVPIAPFHYAAAFLLLVCGLMHLYLALAGRPRA